MYFALRNEESKLVSEISEILQKLASDLKTLNLERDNVSKALLNEVQMALPNERKAEGEEMAQKVNAFDNDENNAADLLANIRGRLDLDKEMIGVREGLKISEDLLFDALKQLQEAQTEN